MPCRRADYVIELRFDYILMFSTLHPVLHLLDIYKFHIFFQYLFAEMLPIMTIIF